MLLKEIGKFEFKGDLFIILESKEKLVAGDKAGKVLYNYWVTIENYARIENIFGLYERATAKEVWEYMCLYGLKYYVDELSGNSEE